MDVEQDLVCRGLVATLGANVGMRATPDALNGVTLYNVVINRRVAVNHSFQGLYQSKKKCVKNVS